MRPLRDLLGADKTVAYGVSPHGDGMATDFVFGSGFPADAFRGAFDAWLADKAFGWAGYNPMRPEPSQRNVVVDDRDVARWTDPQSLPIVREIFPRWGLAESAQLRVLVCDGPLLLAWVGAFQSERFDARQREILRRLVPALRRRLMLERAISRAPQLQASLSAALSAIGVAAFIVSSSGAVLEANEAGRLLLGADRDETLAILRGAIRCRDATSPYEVTDLRSPGGDEQHLVVARRAPPPRAEPPAASAAAQWALTRRQSEVLGLVAQGLSNRAIAQTLGIAEGTVEVHLTAIFEKVGVRSRSALVARVWQA
jgi:DNA-binding NarL/FixJ family response regulator